MFIRNKTLKNELLDTYGIDMSLKQLDRIVKLYSDSNSVIINRVWNVDKIEVEQFITFVKGLSSTMQFKVSPPLPKRYELCKNPHKYNTMQEVDAVINNNGKAEGYKGVKCAKCKKYHMVKKDI